MTQEKIISAFLITLFLTIFVGGIFYLSDHRFAGNSGHERMFRWGFVIFYFVAMFTGHLFMNRITQFFKNLFVQKK